MKETAPYADILLLNQKENGKRIRYSFYFIQINEKNRSIMLEPCNVFKAVRLLNFFSDGINLLKETQDVTSIELYNIGEPLPKRILI